KYISLVNLIMDKEVVKELIQGELNTDNLRKELKAIVAGGLKRRKIMDAYAELKSKLGDHGASEKTARLILGYLGAGLRPERGSEGAGVIPVNPD
ncbi:MAG: hypothetical protein ACYC1Q_10845, partial [Bacteroidia bacterium]